MFQLIETKINWERTMFFVYSFIYVIFDLFANTLDGQWWWSTVESRATHLPKGRGHGVTLKRTIPNSSLLSKKIFFQKNNNGKKEKKRDDKHESGGRPQLGPCLSPFVHRGQKSNFEKENHFFPTGTSRRFFSDQKEKNEDMKETIR